MNEDDLEQRFFALLGAALAKWQLVEGAAYDIFRAFAHGANKVVLSVCFYHIQSFDSRVTLLDRCAYFVVPKEGTLRDEWTDIKTRLTDLTALRNRLAHFSYRKGGTKSGDIVLELGPSYLNSIYAIKDKWKNPDQQPIDELGLIDAQNAFAQLAKDMRRFRDAYQAIAK